MQEKTKGIVKGSLQFLCFPIKKSHDPWSEVEVKNKTFHLILPDCFNNHKCYTAAAGFLHGP